MTEEETVRDVLSAIKVTLGSIVAKLEDFDIHFPMQKLAYLEVEGKLMLDEILPLRDEILDFLKMGYEFKKAYWALIQRSYGLYDTEMREDGNYLPGNRFYQSLRIDMYGALFGNDRDIWIARFDNYAERIRNRLGKKGAPPRNGEVFLSDVYRRVEEEIGGIKGEQRKFLKRTRELSGLVEDLWNEYGKEEGVSGGKEESE